MVLILVRLLEVQARVVLRDLHEFPVEILPELGGDYRMTVFGRKDEVVVAEVYAMTVPAILPLAIHPSTIPERGESDTGTHCIPGLTPRGIFVE